MHEFLALIVGFESVIANDTIFEDPIDTLSLMGSKGFSLDEIDGWTPQLPALKGDGVWADSSTSTGRTLIAGEDGNVVETMHLVLSFGDALEAHRLLVKLYRFIEYAREQWTTFYQTYPVYIKWKAIGGAGYQYALIYNIDASVEYASGVNTGIADVTLTMEREPYWRANPPGTNPKYWYMNKNGPQLTASNRNLNSGSVPQWKIASIYNKSEWSPTALGLQTTLLTQNFVDLNAEDIPGDAPCLLEFVFSSLSTYDVRRLFVSKTTKPLSGLASSGGTNRYNSLDLAAGDAGISVGSKVSLGAGSTIGLVSNSSSTLRYVWDYTVPSGTTSFTGFLAWGQQYSGNLLNLDRTLLSGKFALFLRGNQVTGSPGDVILKVIVEEFEDNSPELVSAQVIADDIQLQNSTTYLNLIYVGTMTMPFAGKRQVSVGGSGKRIGGTKGTFRIRIEGKNTSGSNKNIRIGDLLLIPIDDEALQMVIPYESTGSSTGIIYDNTGYVDLDPNGIVKAWNTDQGGALEGEIRGGVITLTPGRDQRLYFLMDILIDTSGNAESPAGVSADVYMNIVPRWRGVRDV